MTTQKSKMKFTISCSENSKKRFDLLSKKLKKKSTGYPIYSDDIVSYWLDNMTTNDENNIINSKVTIVHIMPKARILWEKEKGKISDENWEFLKVSGKVFKFVKDNFGKQYFEEALSQN